MRSVFTNVLDRDEHSTLQRAMASQGFDTMPDVLSMSTADIESLVDNADPANVQPVNRGDKNLVKVLQAWSHYLKFRQEQALIAGGTLHPPAQTVDWTDTAAITAALYDNFRVGVYDPGRDIRVTHPLTVAVPPPSAPPAPPPPPPAPPRPTPAELFQRSIKRDKSHYTAFKDEAKWHTWRQSVEATARTHECQNVLNNAYVPDPTTSTRTDIIGTLKGCGTNS